MLRDVHIWAIHNLFKMRIHNLFLGYRCSSACESQRLHYSHIQTNTSKDVPATAANPRSARSCDAILALISFCAVLMSFLFH